MAIEKLGNGIGYIYVTDPSNNIIINWPNAANAVRPFLSEALVSGPLSGEVLATASVSISAVSGTGTITNITVNGVSILNVTASGASRSALVADAVTKINSYISTPDYSAFVSGDGTSFVISALSGTGATPNAYVVVVSNTNSTITNTAMANGATTSGTYSTAANGRRFYIYADAAAVPGSISGATEITSKVVQRGSESGVVVTTATIASDTISPTRVSNFQKITTDTQSGDPTDALSIISTSGFIDGDVLQIVGANAARVITLGVVGGAGSILLANSTPFITGDSTNSIQLQYSATLNQWVEIFRTPGLNFTAASVRAAGTIPYPVPGITSTTLTAGGGTITLSPGVSKGILYLSGTPTLVGNWSIVGGGSPIDGDTFYIIYRAIPVMGSSTITIFGSTLTSTQAISGKIYVRATYSSTLTAYTTEVLQDFTAQDWATVASVSAKETGLGNPAADGYVLASTAAGVRYWTPQAGNSYQSVSVVLTSAQIKDLFSTPVDLLPAPPANTCTMLGPDVFIQNKHNTTAYTAASAKLYLQGFGGGTAAISTNSFITSGSTCYARATVSMTNPSTPDSTPNQAIQVYCDGENPTLGDGTFLISFTYRIVNAI